MDLLYIEKEKQQTLADEIIVKGVSLHSGKKAEIKVKPAPIDTGILFTRSDLDTAIKIKAEPASVVNLVRNTTIGRGEDAEQAFKIKTIEHLMAAIWGAGIDNLLVEVAGPEIPVTDGSAFPYYEKFLQVGIKKQSKPRSYYKITEAIFARDEAAYIVILPYDGFKISYTLDYQHPVIGTSFYEYNQASDDFAAEISKARTFGFEKEAEKMYEQGLALGASLENVVLIGEQETVNPMRYQNEFVRHKILDVIGDMSLNGRIMGHVIAVKSGHRLHVELATKIREKMLEEEN